eukprot:TRINITY_DN16857_c0_g4_i1.p1 TRINITY_DN16857_c0_g4~~TRINITY_DN16857_c0_g4_i1.p1  ORF type:complete len:1179 (+),score=279.26 TRINITY_DN16857_c0_g4_i1:187-3723(+)
MSLVPVLSALRRLLSGVGDEASVYRAAAAALVARSAAEAAEAAAKEEEREQAEVVGAKDRSDGSDSESETAGLPAPTAEVAAASAAEVVVSEDEEEDSEAEAAAEAAAATGFSAEAQAEAKAELDGLCGAELGTELYTWGQAQNFQLGFGATAGDQPAPRLVPLPLRSVGGGQVRVLSVACGRLHSVAVTACGSVLSWGVGGNFGRLGLEPSSSGSGGARDGMSSAARGAFCAVEPTPLPEFGAGKRHVAKKAATGSDHTLVLTASGQVLAWGSNRHGQLGVQGVPLGEDACCPRPGLLKAGPLRGELVVDIAAGLEHSLCATDSGAAFAWGSNAAGALGLGIPPGGPAEASVPQQLPYLRGVYAVAASASGHISVALAAHGDAMLFGGATLDGKTAPDPKCFVPNRVRRKATSGLGAGATSADAEEWLTQRGGGAGASGFAPLAAGSICFSAEEAFAIDRDSQLWSWPLRGPRPCFAEVVEVFAPAQGVPATSSAAAGASSAPQRRRAAAAPLRFRSVAVSEQRGCLWASSSTSSASLWRLQPRAEASPASAGRGGAGQARGWQAEHFEHLAQVARVVCGPAHQCALVRFRRPAPLLPAAEKQERGRGVRSLQGLCEDKLCSTIGPRSLPTVCQVAWELFRAPLLDRAYEFLCDNAALMLSRVLLPNLAQIHPDILAAFELAAAGKVSSPSLALEGDGIPLDELEDVEAPADVTSDQSGGKTTTNASGQRRRRRGAGSGSADAQGTTESAFEPTTPVTAAQRSPALAATSSNAATLSPGLPGATAVKANATVSSSPKATLLPADGWSLVPTSRGRGGRGGGKGAASRGAGLSPKLSPMLIQEKAADVGRGAQATPPVVASAPAKTVPAVPLPTLADFVVRPKASSAAMASSSPTAQGGPSAALSAAVSAAKTAPWSSPKVSVAAAPSTGLREVLSEGNEKAAPRRRANTLGDNPARDPTRCSWGFDAMPSEKPKGQSVYHIQEQEAAEEAQRKADQEIQDIEAMFAALEVAEKYEELERSGQSVSSAAPDATQKRSGGKGKNGGPSSKDSKSGKSKGGKGTRDSGGNRGQQSSNGDRRSGTTYEGFKASSGGGGGRRSGDRWSSERWSGDRWRSWNADGWSVEGWWSAAGAEGSGEATAEARWVAKDAEAGASAAPRSGGGPGAAGPAVTPGAAAGG